MWKRSWFRWTVRCVALVLLALLAVTFYYRSRGADELTEARKEFEAKVGPLEPAAYQPKRVQDEDNGAVWLLAGAHAAVVFEPEREGLRSLADTPASQWTKEQVELARRLLERNGPALTLLRRSQGMKVCNLEAAISDEGKHGLQFIMAARLLVADSRDALRQGDMDRFFSSAEAVRTLTSAQEGEAELIGALIGSYSERLLLPVIQEAASAPTLESIIIKRFEALIPTVDLMNTMRRSLGYETAAMVDRITGGWEEQYVGIKSGWIERLPLWTIGDSDLAYALRIRVKALEPARQPYAQRGAPSPAPHRPTLFPSRVLGSADLYQWDSRGTVAGRFQETLALRQMTTLGLEVRRAGLEHGVYPADLSGFPGAKTPDPFSGKPVAYTLHTDGSATLAIPDADSLYKKLTARTRLAAGFTWTLPPVTAGKPSPSRHPAK